MQTDISAVMANEEDENGLWLSVVGKADDTSAVGLFFDVHADGVFGQDVCYELRPFDETGMPRIEVVVRTYVDGLGEALDPVKIKVKDRAVELMTVVFVDDGKGGRIDHVIHLQCLAKSFDECGFSGSHLAVKGKHPAAGGV